MKDIPKINQDNTFIKYSKGLRRKNMIG